MTLLKDVLKIRTGGREVAKVKYGGKEIWPNDTFRLELSQQEVSFTAAGGTAVIEVYGVTIRSGVEIERRRLDNSEMSALILGPVNWVRLSGPDLTVRVLNAGTTASAALEDTCRVTWNEHPEIYKDIALSRGANVKTYVGGQYTTPEYPISSPIIWAGSGTDTARASGDNVSMSTCVNLVVKQDYEWSSGVTGTEVLRTTQDYDNATMDIFGDGISVSIRGAGTGRYFYVTYARNSTGAARSGQLAVMYRHGGGLMMWRFNVKQAA